MYINNNGKVGIGTYSPNTSLEVNGGIRARGGAPGAGGTNNNGYTFDGTAGDNDAGIFSTADNTLQFFTDASERMRISGSRVGIGTTSPSYILDISGSGDEKMLLTTTTAGQGSALMLQNSGNTNSPRMEMQLTGSNTDQQSYLRFNYGGSTGVNDILVIKGNGNIGIGTTNPTYKLDIKSTDQNLLILNGSSAASTQYTAMKIAPNGDVWEIGGRGSTNAEIANGFYIHNNNDGLFRFIISDAGNVGIGTTSPEQILHINSSSDAAITVSSPSTTCKNIYWKNNDNSKIWEWSHRDSGDGGNFWLNYYDGASWNSGILSATTAGNIGIGTTNPARAKLVVNGSVNYDNGSYGYLISSGSVGTSSGASNTSIYASGRIICPEFNASSDERIKAEIPKTGSYSNLVIINKLRPVDYKMKDEIQYGTQTKKGFFAQEVEKIIPDAVTKSSDFIPDIFQLSQALSYNKNFKILNITLEKPHNLKIGDKVRLILEKEIFEKTVVSVVNNNIFSVDDWNRPTEKVFVYGKFVKDFRTLDYNQIFTAGIGAIQELSKENEYLKKEIEQLKQKDSLLIDLIKRLEKLENKAK